MTDSRKVTLCIPRVVESHTTQFIKNAFERAIPRAKVLNVTMVNKQQKEGAKGPESRVFVEFSSWPETDKANFLWDRIHASSSIKVVYAYPKFWKCFLARPRVRAKRAWQGGNDVLSDFVE